MTRPFPSKSETMSDICALLEIPLVSPTVGSSVPRVFFDDIATQMGLHVHGSMPQMARTIIEASRLEWHEEFSSELSPSGGGGTVTALGILQIKNAVLAWLGKPVIGLPENIIFTSWSPIENWFEIRSQLVREEVRVLTRPGASDFRAAVMEEYGSRCAVSGITSPDAIEVAHIVPYFGAASNVVQNAIPMRADIHKLFDAGLIRIEYSVSNKKYTCVVHDFVLVDYDSYHGKDLRVPVDPMSHPSRRALEIKHELHKSMWQSI